jgi:RimJ/RimL family protein N-acetyltransferase
MKTPDKELPAIETELIRCLPFTAERDFDFLTSLVQRCKFTQLSSEQIKKHLQETEGYFWKILDTKTGAQGGVIYFSKHAGDSRLWFHAYKDDALAKRLSNKADYSYKAAKLILKYASENFKETIATMHSIDNRGATILCKRLGFTKTDILKTEYGPFIVMTRRN